MIFTNGNFELIPCVNRQTLQKSEICPQVDHDRDIIKHISFACLRDQI